MSRFVWLLFIILWVTSLRCYYDKLLGVSGGLRLILADSEVVFGWLQKFLGGFGWFLVVSGGLLF